MGEIKQGYKQTEFGLIPEDWEIRTIGEVAKITTGRKNTEDKIDYGTFPFYVRSQIIEKINSYSFDCEGVLTAGDGVGTGKVFHYINGKFDFHQRVYLIYKFDNKLFGKYFYWFFSRSFYDRMNQLTAKSSVDSVRREMIADMPIILPTLAEQTAIATALSDVDNLIAALDKKITKKQQIKQGAMQQLLTGKKRLPGFSGNSKFKQTELGLIPEDWDVIELGEISANIGYGLGAAAISYDGENKYIRITDIDERTRKFSPSPLSSPTFFLDSFHVNEGDILFARTGASVGKSYLYNKNDGRLIFAGFLIRFNIVNAIPEYVYYHTFTRKYNEWILSESARTGQPGVNVEQLKSFQIPFPKDFAEQTAIAQVLTDMDNEISQLEADRNKYEQIKAGMMQQLLTGKVRLMVND